MCGGIKCFWSFYLFYFLPGIAMYLQPLDVFDDLSPDELRNSYYLPGKPVVIKSLSKNWPAYSKWNWEFLKKVA
jgi:hypothetical protein